jgi:drug/metabolite transporter (DMT)-like permease
MQSEAEISLRDRVDRARRLALVVGITLACVWGAMFTVQKHAMDAFGPDGFLLLRYAAVQPVCAIVLLAILSRRGSIWLPRDDLLRLAGLGLIGHLLHIGIVTYGVYWSTAFSSSLILSCGPVYTLLLLRLIGERLGRAQVLGVLIALLGVLIFLSDKLLGARWQASGGDLALLIAGLCFSWYTIASRPLNQRLGIPLVLGWATLFGSPAVVLVSWAAAARVEWSAAPLTAWAGTIFIAAVTSFGGWLLWAWVNRLLGLARSAPIMYLMTPTAGLVAWLAKDELFSAAKITGAIIALIGVAIAQQIIGRKRVAR